MRRREKDPAPQNRERSRRMKSTPKILRAHSCMPFHHLEEPIEPVPQNRAHQSCGAAIFGGSRPFKAALVMKRTFDILLVPLYEPIATPQPSRDHRERSPDK